MDKRFVYADNAATTCISKTAYNAMLPYLTEQYFNPSSLYTPSQKVHAALEQARQTVAECIGAAPNEIYFTSGGTESDNTAILSCARLGAESGKRHIVSAEFEHHAVLNTLKAIHNDNRVTLIKPWADGRIMPGDIASAIKKDTCLVSVMMANNETGTIQFTQDYGFICREKNVIFHTDAVQAAGHIRINVRELNVDMLSMSAHKFHGPKGIGVLYIRNGIKRFPMINGGKQENGYRAGTENVAGAVGLAVALKESCDNLQANYQFILRMRNKLIDGLLDIPHTKLNGCQADCIPGTMNICFEGIQGEALLHLLDSYGICISAGSACMAGSRDPSHVLKSIGLPTALSASSVRISIGEYNTMEDIDYMLQVIPEAVKTLRKASPVWEELETGKREHLC